MQGSGGMQLGTTSMINCNPNSPMTDLYLHYDQTTSNESRKEQKKIADKILDEIIDFEKIEPEKVIEAEKPSVIENRDNDKKSFNYIHASNPNLVDYDFHSKPTIDFSIPKPNASSIHWDMGHGDVQGMVTLKDLMLQKQEEEAMEMYNKRVCLGIEKGDDRTLLKKKNKTVEKESNLTQKPADPYIEKIQKRSLPNTPDYGLQWDEQDKNVLYTRSKEGQKLRDFGYETLNSDDGTTDFKSKKSTQGNEKLWTNKVVPSGSIKKKSLNWMISSHDNKKHDESQLSATTSTSSLLSGGSFRKTKNKLQASSEKLFQFKTLDKKPNNNVFSSTPDKQSHQQQQIFNLRSPTDVDNNAMRKNSAPNPSSSYFTKLSFSTSNKTAKEKKILGSPRLHRAIFGKNSNSSTVDHEVFAPISYVRTEDEDYVEFLNKF